MGEHRETPSFLDRIQMERYESEAELRLDYWTAAIQGARDEICNAEESGKMDGNVAATLRFMLSDYGLDGMLYRFHNQTARIEEERPVLPEMPPDLAAVSDAALSAFLHRELFGETEMVMRPAVDVWDEVTHYDPEFHHEPDHPAWAFLTYEIDGETFYEALDDLCTPSGALRVIEAMGEREWHTASVYNYRTRQHEVKCIHGSDLHPQETDPVSYERYGYAVCLAACLALLPAASGADVLSAEGRRILNTP